MLPLLGVPLVWLATVVTAVAIVCVVATVVSVGSRLWRPAPYHGLKPVVGEYGEVEEEEEGYPLSPSPSPSPSPPFHHALPLRPASCPP
jgi:hypothetical protein